MTVPGSPRQKCAVANLRTLSARTSLPDVSTDRQTANTFLCRDYRPTDWAEADVIPPDAKADVIPPEFNGQGRAQIAHAMLFMNAARRAGPPLQPAAKLLRRQIIVFWVASAPSKRMSAEICPKISEVCKQSESPPVISGRNRRQ